MSKNNKKDMNNNEKEEKNVILINKMYTGSYLDDNDGNNIGHEIINFFKADDGNNYIYITPYGKYKYGKRIKYVLFTTPKIDGKYKIIAKAEIEENKVNEKGENNNKYILKEPYRQEHNEQALQIKYGGKSIYDIYKDNINNNEAIYASFKVKKISKVKNEATIEVNLNSTKNSKVNKTVVTINKDDFDPQEIKNKNTKKEDVGEKESIKEKENKKIPLNIGMSNKIYLDPNDDDEGQRELAVFFEKIIEERDDLWQEEKVSEIPKQEEQQGNKKFNFMNLIQKEYDENIFTNLLFYYFNTKYKNENKTDIILNKFLSWLSENKKEFNCDSKKFDFYEILKEYTITIKEKGKEEKKDEQENKTNSENISKGRIDLFASKDNTYLVIENKIKSKINGKKENGYQLSFYKDAIETNYTNPKFIGIILVPNYNEEIIKNEEGYKNAQSYYTVVYYNEIYDFFAKEIKEKNMLDENAKHYYRDFTDALYIHTLDAKTKEENKFKEAIFNAREVEYTVFVASFEKNESKENDKKEKIERKYYIGTTTNLDRRKRELSEIDKFKGYKIEKIIWQKKYKNLEYAMDMEKKLEKKLEEKLNEIETTKLLKDDIEEQVVVIENNTTNKGMN